MLKLVTVREREQRKKMIRTRCSKSPREKESPLLFLLPSNEWRSTRIVRPLAPGVMEHQWIVTMPAFYEWGEYMRSGVVLLSLKIR